MSLYNNSKLGLIILDGWGIGDRSQSDAIYHAVTPTMDHLLATYPNARLTTFGEAVGLPEGQMGNSEVGHLNIGAGRIVYQELTRINKAIREGAFFRNEILVDAFTKAKQTNAKVHLMGLVSKGGVHSSQEHLYALCGMAKSFDLSKVYIHAFTDGRDCDPKSAYAFLQELLEKTADTPARLATICGRYFAMDRDNRWERVAKAYRAMVHGTGQAIAEPLAAIQASYEAGITDEFIEPMILCNQGEPVVKMEAGDVVISFNFRTDRPREIVNMLCQNDFPEYQTSKIPLHVYTMTNYDQSFENIAVVFEKDNLKNTLGEVFAKLGKSQVRIAETEKYPHVTFFFSGGREKPFFGEDRILVPSPKVATYDLQPEMSATEVKDKIITSMHEQKPSFFCLNFANPDMVGHTGDYAAIVKAVEKVDSCLGEIIAAGQNEGYDFIVIADHGNADYALNADGSPNTAHSLNPVPVILVPKKVEKIKLVDGILADVAPTILRRMGIATPFEMTGKSLIENI